MKVMPYVNLAAQWHEERKILLPIIENVMASGQYVGGEQIEEFELEASRALDVENVVALNSGTDALVCGLLAVGVGPGDEVITPPNSFVASTAAIVHLRAKPVFVDVKEDQNIDPALIERAITQHTKAIMPVHLTGRMAEMKVICEIAERHG
ncbi:transcriptional regulator, partial [Bacteroidetes bacterium SCGC AAA795-G10]